MIGPTDLLHSSPAPHFKTFQVFPICCRERPSFSTIHSLAPNVAQDSNILTKQSPYTNMYEIRKFQTHTHRHRHSLLFIIQLNQSTILSERLVRSIWKHIFFRNKNVHRRTNNSPTTQIQLLVTWPKDTSFEFNKEYEVWVLTAIILKSVEIWYGSLRSFSGKTVECVNKTG